MSLLSSPVNTSSNLTSPNSKPPLGLNTHGSRVHSFRSDQGSPHQTTFLSKTSSLSDIYRSFLGRHWGPISRAVASFDSVDVVSGHSSAHGSSQHASSNESGPPPHGEIPVQQVTEEDKGSRESAVRRILRITPRYPPGSGTGPPPTAQVDMVPVVMRSTPEQRSSNVVSFHPTMFRTLVATDAFTPQEVKSMCIELHDALHSLVKLGPRRSFRLTPAPVLGQQSPVVPAHSLTSLGAMESIALSSMTVSTSTPAALSQTTREPLISTQEDANIPTERSAGGRNTRMPSSGSPVGLFEVLNKTPQPEATPLEKTPNNPSRRTTPRPKSFGSSCSASTSTCSRLGVVASPHSNKSTTSLPRRSIDVILGNEDEEDAGMIAHYEIVAELGRGSFGCVNLAIDATNGETYAIKTTYRGCKLGRTLSSRFLEKEGTAATDGGSHRTSVVSNEIAVMQNIRHKNLVELYAVIEDPSQHQCHLVMQYVENGPVSKVLSDGSCKRVDYRDAVYYMVQVSSGLSCLHRHGILHRDIKPENILIGKNRTAYVSDFGTSEIITNLKGNPHRRRGGTMAFMSPELIESSDALTRYGSQIDVWAFGVTLYAILYGRLPFNGGTFPAMIKSIMQDELRFPTGSCLTSPNTPIPPCASLLGSPVMVPMEVPPVLQGILRRLLDRDPQRRMTLHEFRRNRIIREIANRAKLSPIKRASTASPFHFSETMSQINSSCTVPEEAEISGGKSQTKEGEDSAELRVDVPAPPHPNASVDGDASSSTAQGSPEIQVSAASSLTKSDSVNHWLDEEEASCGTGTAQYTPCTVAQGQVLFSRCRHELTPDAATVVCSYADRIRKLVQTQRRVSLAVYLDDE